MRREEATDETSLSPASNAISHKVSIPSRVGPARTQQQQEEEEEAEGGRKEGGWRLMALDWRLKWRKRWRKRRAVEGRQRRIGRL